MISCTTIIPYTAPLAPEEFICREVERAKPIASVDGRSLSLSKENKAFLIEGSRTDSTNSKFPE